VPDSRIVHRAAAFADRHDRALLATLMLVFIGARSAAAVAHPIPRLFPDEYIYTALARSIGHGHLAIRGQTTLFPGVFEPLLAAPIWRAFHGTTAYHLVQIENVVVASLAAPPVYILARRLGLGAAYGLVCALYTLLVPTLTFVAFTQSDAIGYTLALGSVAAGVLALDRPTRASQLTFLVLSTAAVATRVEYFALAVAFAAAALVMDRLAAFRRHAVPLLALIPAAAVVVLGSVSYYDPSEAAQAAGLPGYLSWILLEPYLLAIEAGIVLVPGALAGLIFARSRVERSFRWLFLALAAILIVESAKASAETSAFKERYVFVLLPFVVVWFGVYIRLRCPGRRIVPLVSIALLIAAARLPLSAYATESLKLGSPFLTAFADVGSSIGIANASLVVALAVAVLAIAAIAARRRTWALVGILFTLALTFSMSVDATRTDITTTKQVQATYSRDPTWVDDAHLRQVTAISTGAAIPGDLLQELYWNSSITREVVIDPFSRTDVFRAFPLSIDASGRMTTVGQNFLTADAGARIIPANARRVASAPRFTLWHATGQPRLRAFLKGLYSDNWLSDEGQLRFWAQHSNDTVDARFRLSLPGSFAHSIHFRLGRHRFTVAPGAFVDVDCQGYRRVAVSYQSPDAQLQQQFNWRRISVRLTRLRITDRVIRDAVTDGCTATAAHDPVADVGAQ
jgi:hypothetical protein